MSLLAFIAECASMYWFCNICFSLLSFVAIECLAMCLPSCIIIQLVYLAFPAVDECASDPCQNQGTCVLFCNFLCVYNLDFMPFQCFAMYVCVFLHVFTIQYLVVSAPVVISSNWRMCQCVYVKFRCVILLFYVCPCL